MDFTKLDSREASETAIPYHLRYQGDTGPHKGGDLIWDGDKPCRVLVRGAAGRAFQEEMRVKAREDMKKPKGKDDADSLEAFQESMIRAATNCIVGFENIERDGKPAKVPDDVKWFLDLNFISLPHINRKDGDDWKKPSFAQQIVDVATDQSGFLDATLKP